MYFSKLSRVDWSYFSSTIVLYLIVKWSFFKRSYFSYAALICLLDYSLVAYIIKKVPTISLKLYWVDLFHFYWRRLFRTTILSVFRMTVCPMAPWPVSDILMKERVLAFVVVEIVGEPIDFGCLKEDQRFRLVLKVYLFSSNFSDCRTW